MIVEVAIDELVLRGVAPEQATAVAAAVQSQLTLLAIQSSVGAEPCAAPRAESSRRLPALALPACAPETLGSAVAGAVWSDITGGSG